MFMMEVQIPKFLFCFQECEDWKYIAMVLDRLFLYVFWLLNIFGLVIFLRAPSLYDNRESIDMTMSDIIAQRRFPPPQPSTTTSPPTETSTPSTIIPD